MGSHWTDLNEDISSGLLQGRGAVRGDELNVAQLSSQALLPWVYDHQADALEVGNVASCQRGGAENCDGRNLRIELTDRATCLASFRCNCTVDVCGFPIERQRRDLG
jgi:hypothetical protein